jgi:hypothetical protein
MWMWNSNAVANFVLSLISEWPLLFLQRMKNWPTCLLAKFTRSATGHCTDPNKTYWRIIINVSPPPNSQARGLPFLGRPRLLNRYIRSYPLYLDAISIRNLKMQWQGTHLAWSSCFVFGRSQVQISAPRPAILTGVFDGFLSPSWQMPRLCLRSGHDVLSLHFAEHKTYRLIV